MKRVNITTLTIGLVSLVILLIATMIAQCMSGKEGFAGGGRPAKFFSSASMRKGSGPNYRLDANLETENGQPMFDVPLATQLEGETNEEFYKRLATIDKGFRGYSFATFENNTWYDLEYESGGEKYSASSGISPSDNLLEYGLDFGNRAHQFTGWDRKYPLRIVMDYVRSDGTKYSSTYYFYDGIFTYDWPPPSTAAKPIFDPDNRGQDDGPKEGEIISAGSVSQIGDPIGPGLESQLLGGPGMGGPGMGGYDMGGYGMGGYDMGGHGMGGHGMGGPGRKRPIIINVNNTGGAYAPMEQHPMGDHGHHGHHGHPSSNVTYTHELSEDAEKKLTKTMNFMEFVVKKSQS